MMVGAVACDKKENKNPGPGPGTTEFEYVEPVLTFGADVSTTLTAVCESLNYTPEALPLQFFSDALNGFNIKGNGGLVIDYQYFFTKDVIIDNGDGTGSLDVNNGAVMDLSLATMPASNIANLEKFLQEKYTDSGQKTNDGATIYTDAAKTFLVAARTSGTLAVAQYESLAGVSRANDFASLFARHNHIFEANLIAK